MESGITAGHGSILGSVEIRSWAIKINAADKLYYRKHRAKRSQRSERGVIDHDLINFAIWETYVRHDRFQLAK